MKIRKEVVQQLVRLLDWASTNISSGHEIFARGQITAAKHLLKAELKSHKRKKKKND